MNEWSSLRSCSSQDVCSKINDLLWMHFCLSESLQPASACALILSSQLTGVQLQPRTGALWRHAHMELVLLQFVHFGNWKWPSAGPQPQLSAPSFYFQHKWDFKWGLTATDHNLITAPDLFASEDWNEKEETGFTGRKVFLLHICVMI